MTTFLQKEPFGGSHVRRVVLFQRTHKWGLPQTVQAVAETEPEKLRKRCTPPVGKHNIFGVGEANEEAVQVRSAKLHLFSWG